jgi:type II secretory ATPase GspE/PulE/Tfp pilus assembly ATPase PilB-like protein
MFLRDCQLKASVLNSRVQALVAQQSVRNVCQDCKQPDLTEQAKLFLENLAQEGGESTTPELWMPQGCPKCHMSGYTQNIVLYEILRLESWLQEMLLCGASLLEIQAEAEEHKFQSLKKKATELLLSGQTSLEEVFSIIQC